MSTFTVKPSQLNDKINAQIDAFIKKIIPILPNLNPEYTKKESGFIITYNPELDIYSYKSILISGTISIRDNYEITIYIKNFNRFALRQLSFDVCAS